jgi:hypothetical protein
MSRAIVVVAASLLVVASAQADVGVELDKTRARPGERVRATGHPYFLSLYLAPESTVPPLQPCGNGELCRPTSLGPPKRKGWIWLGRFFPTRATFHFRVPAVRPGRYRPVVYCAPCVRGPSGSLIAGDRFYVLSR